jgi:SMP-30/gluconolaconase/LRE-like protein
MRKLCLILSAAALLIVAALPAQAATATVLVQWNEANGENPEGLAISKTGSIFVSFPFIGQIREISRDGSQHAYASLPSENGFGPLGLAVDATGALYACVVTFNPATHGVYRVASDGSSIRLPGTEAIGFPNGLAFDQRGNIYVGDSLNGEVWRIPRGGSAEVWLADPTLAGDNSGPLPTPIGANGIAVHHNTVYVTNTELGQLVTIPIRPDGAAGDAAVLAQSPALGGSDGIALDVHGNIWVPVIAQSTIVRVSSDGSTIDTFATASDGLDFASSIAFGTGAGTRKTLYAVSFSISELFGGPPGSGPALVSFDAGVPGDPLP